jgi:sugar phosphate isomerase/epimerase
MPISIGMLLNAPKLRAEGLETLAAWAKGVGLDALELERPEDYSEAAQVCRARGLQISGVRGAGGAQTLSRDDRTREVAVNRMREQIRALPQAGSRVLILVLVPEDRAQPIADSLAIYRETFPAIAAELEAAGVRAAIEGWPGPSPHYPALGYTPETWRAMFEAVPSAAIGLNYDPSHLVRLGIDYLRVLDEFKERVYHCHGKDTALLAEQQFLYGHFPPALGKSPAFSAGAWRYCIPGDGEVSWSKVAYTLQQAGFDGCVSIELEDARYWGSLELEQQGIAKAYQHLSMYFK